jgi:NAD(P)-dependent dehydrogenase (short-subunit alcohol dehydrogenase family)
MVLKSAIVGTWRSLAPEVRPSVADVVAFLASDAARFMIGAIVPVDGGAAL